MTSLFKKTLPLVTSAALAGILLHARPAGAIRGCELMDCGSNTPIIYGTPIQGLSLRPGERSLLGAAAAAAGSGVWVELDSTLTRARAPWGWWKWWRTTRPECFWAPTGSLHLGVQRGELIAKNGRGDTVCRGKEMIGMVFSIRVPITTCREVSKPDPKQPNTCGRSVTVCESQRDGHVIQLRIDEMGEVRDWISGGAPDEKLHRVPTYRLVLHSVPSAATDPELAALPLVAGTSLCPLREKWMSDWQVLKPDLKNVETHVVPVAGAVERTWREATDHLLIVQGETYKLDASVQNSGESWFNLACAGTALSKLRLLGYDPMTQPAQAPERQATLKMLTGRYRGEQSFTSPGMPLWWEHQGATPTFLGTPAPGRLSGSNIEAYWGPDGALCLSHRRTWRSPRAVPGTVDEYTHSLTPEADPPGYLPPGCTHSPAPARCALAVAEAEKRSLQALRDQGLPECTTPPSSYHWVTRPVDHVSH